MLDGIAVVMCCAYSGPLIRIGLIKASAKIWGEGGSLPLGPPGSESPTWTFCFNLATKALASTPLALAATTPKATTPLATTNTIASTKWIPFQFGQGYQISIISCFFKCSM